MINCKNWKKLQNDITTDSLWLSNTNQNNNPLFIIPKRDWNIKNDSTFHGLFIPEIPYQFINRFLPENGVIWDCFSGSGTTYRVAKYLNISEDNIICTDITPKQSYIKYGDALDYKCKSKADLVFCHPPYLDIVKYSDNYKDGSNISDIGKFMKWMNSVCINIIDNVNKNAIVILILGNIYKDGEEKTLGVWVKDIFCKNGFKCKSHIIKDYGQTKNTNNSYNLNYYRQLKSGYNNFYGDNIFILKYI